VPVLAVHISDGILSPAFLAVGFVVAALMLVPALWRIHEDEIPRIGLLTAAFFVASTIHVKVGVTSVHLLLNGLVGVVLGRRAPLAITVALGLQALLLGHGGFVSLGVNAVVMTLPALAAAGVFQVMGGQRTRGRAFWAGCACGALAVLLTAGLYSATLVVAGVEDFRVVAVAAFAVHLPLAAIEGLIVGVAAGYLARVKRELLRRPDPTPTEAVEAGGGPEPAGRLDRATTSSRSRTGS
jgi:cobalt/nickel transport system permease protein